MSIGEQLITTYQEVLSKFDYPQVTPNNENYQTYPRIIYKTSQPINNLFPNLIEACTQLYNEIDSAVTTLKMAIPEAYKDLEPLITEKRGCRGNALYVFQSGEADALD